MTPSPAEYGPIELHKASPGVSSPARLWHTTRASFIRPASLSTPPSTTQRRPRLLRSDAPVYHAGTLPSTTQGRSRLLRSDAAACPPATLPPTLPRRTHNAASDSVDYVCEATFIW
ncbi:hypothetical protein BD626DRAFT_499694 [Schizophyllum amplum]|uniref:Uncharacterized protein n=1 Tax=Schizophyllum amplum TaxID=97359 RepID=A0A550CBA7_9AGAR|nr:hypothetical protein BD626DRAFT_499694 [Auriculariopsis ampla]